MFNTELERNRALPISLALCLLSALGCDLIFRSYRGDIFTIASLCRVLLLGLTLFIIHLYSTTSFRRYRPKLKELCTLHAVILFSAFLTWFSKVFATIVARYLEREHPIAFLQGLSADTLMLIIPFTVGAFLIQAVAGLQYGMVFTLSFTAILIIHPFGPEILIPFCLITCLAACLSLSHVRSRSAYLKSGLTVGIAALVFALLSLGIYPPSSTSDAIARPLFAFCSAIIASIIATGATPILEYLSGYITDMRLIEISTLDHPLLKRLSVQAPGTWNHSMVVGMMVEAAASEIGANPVLARVGAYFHDIGKMNKPLYFIENQSSGVNRHDKLSPSMSALVIKSHVKEGIELATEHKLPRSVIEMIPQHHGTCVIEFFYEKAIKEAQESNAEEEVDRNAYSYAGPKPQTREAALLMLADGIESASRTITEPTSDRLQGLINKMINKIFASGELDESDITLRDLHIIAKTFTRVLTGIHHHRIKYDDDLDFESPTRHNNKDSKSNETHETPATTGSEDLNSDRTGNDRNNSRSSGLKRLGID